LKKFMTLFAALAIVISGLGFAHVTAPAAEATGNCTTGYVVWYKDTQQGGYSRKFCYGVNDPDIESEPIPQSMLMGPLADGTYKDDFDALGASSGISSMWIYDNPNDGTAVNVCFYYGQDYREAAGWLGNGGYSFNILQNDAIGSFKFTSATSC
jgi:hypothetical protein